MVVVIVFVLLLVLVLLNGLETCGGVHTCFGIDIAYRVVLWCKLDRKVHSRDFLYMNYL